MKSVDIPHFVRARKRKDDDPLSSKPETMANVFERRRYKMNCWIVYMLLAVFHIILRSGISMAFVHVQRSSCNLLTVLNSKKKTGDEFRNTGDDENETNRSARSVTNLNMTTFRLRKKKLILQNRQQRWHQPPNPLLEDPIDFVQAILVALQQRREGATCLLLSSTPKWRGVLLKSVGAPSNSTNEQVARSLQSALGRPNNQFAILTTKLEGNDVGDKDFSSAIESIQKSWHFPSDPVVFEGDDEDKREEGGRIIDHCWIESRLRSPEDNQLLAVVGWSLQRWEIMQEQHFYNSGVVGNSTNNFTSYWLLDGIDWQDFRDEFRPGIGREEWERICG